MRTLWAALAVLWSASGTPAVRAPQGTSPAARHGGDAALVARAILWADDYQPGPPSGARARADNDVTPPCPGQPVPGFSAILDGGDGTFLAMPDNGYGEKGNSSDFLLRLYHIRPDFRTSKGGIFS